MQLFCNPHTSRWVADELPGRSETTDLIVEITLQPWNSFRPDGLILFRWICCSLCVCLAGTFTCQATDQVQLSILGGRSQ